MCTFVFEFFKQLKMKNTVVLLLILVIGLFWVGCKKDEVENPAPDPQPTTYRVSYSLSIFGGYDSLEMSYFEANNVKRFKSAIKLPWEEAFSNYNILDSVALRVNFTPLPNRTVTYEYEVKITKGSEFIDGNSFSTTMNTGQNPSPILIGWVSRID